MKKNHSKQHKEQGSAFVSILTVIGLMGLTAGGAMLVVGDIILDTAKTGDESMHASRLGNERNASSGDFNDNGSPGDIGPGGGPGAPDDSAIAPDTDSTTPPTIGAAPSGEVTDIAPVEPLDRDRMHAALGIPSEFEGTSSFIPGAEYEVADSGGIATDAVAIGTTPGTRTAPQWFNIEGGPFERTQYLESSGLAYEIGLDGERTGRTWNTENGEVQEFTEGMFGYSDWTWGLAGWGFSEGRFTPGYRTVEQNDDWIMDTSVFDQRQIDYFQEAPLLSFWADEDDERGIYTMPVVGGVMEGAGVGPIVGLVDSGLGLVGGNWQWGEEFARDTHLAANSSAAGRDAAMATMMVTLFADVVSLGGTSIRHARHLDEIVDLGEGVARRVDDIPVTGNGSTVSRQTVADADIALDGTGPRFLPVEQGNFRYAMRDADGNEIGYIRAIIRSEGGEDTLLLTVEVNDGFRRSGAAPRLYQHLDQEGFFRHVQRAESHLEWDNAARFRELAAEGRASGMNEAASLRHAAENFPTSRQWTDRGWTVREVNITDSGPEIIWQRPPSAYSDGLTPFVTNPKLDDVSRTRLQEIAAADMPDAQHRVVFEFDDGYRSPSQSFSGEDLAGVLQEAADSPDIIGVTILDGAPGAVPHSSIP